MNEINVLNAINGCILNNNATVMLIASKLNKEERIMFVPVSPKGASLFAYRSNTEDGAWANMCENYTKYRSQPPKSYLKRVGFAVVECSKDEIESKHKPLKHTDCQIHNCPICDGGLITCVVCGSSENELTTHCPGSNLEVKFRKEVQDGKLDYINYEWIRK